MNKFEYFNSFYKYLYIAKVYGFNDLYKVGVTRSYKKRINSLVADTPIGFEFIAVFSGPNVYSKEQDFIHEFESHTFDISFPGCTEYIYIPESVYNTLLNADLLGYSLCHTWKP